MFVNDMIAEQIEKSNEENVLKESSEKKRKPRKLPVALSPEEFEQLIKNTLKIHHRLAFLFAFGSGLRISEVLKLEPRHIRLDEKTILIELGKGSKDRIVPIPKGFKNKHINLLPIKCGERALEKAFKRACERAKLLDRKPTLHFHSLRHGFATHSIRQGIKIHHLRTMLGHSNISTTNIYLESNPQEAIREYEELF